MPKPDWGKLRAEYLRGGVSYRELAAKYGLCASTLEKRAKREGWAAELRRVSSELAALAFGTDPRLTPRDRLGALRLLGERLGMWEPREEAREGGIVLIPAEMTPEEFEIMLASQEGGAWDSPEAEAPGLNGGSMR